MSDYSKEQRLAAGFIVGIVVTIPVWCYCFYAGSVAREQAEAELATRTGISHWWHENDPSKAAGNYYLLGTVCTVGACWLAYLMSPITLGISEAVSESKRKRKLQESMQEMDADVQQQSRQLNVAQSKQEIVMRLGSIDQFIRVYRIESEPSRQVIALQAAQGELTNLNGKVASREIDSESLTDSHVTACVRETISDLCRAGLADDRLTRDLRRMFNVRDAA